MITNLQLEFFSYLFWVRFGLLAKFQLHILVLMLKQVKPRHDVFEKCSLATILYIISLTNLITSTTFLH